jgi:pimeloyl-ACP methyl ester carboxylesterase
MSRQMLEKTVALAKGPSVHYYEWPGSGPNLVLLHPSSGYGRMWEWTADHLGDQFHIFAPDQRGHGQTDKPDGDYSAQEYAGDLLLFMDALAIDRAVIAGQSLGGRVGQVFAAEHPERTIALGLVGGPHLSNFFPTTEAVKSVLASSQRTLTAPFEFSSREAALQFLRSSRPRDQEAALQHRLDHNFEHRPDGSAVLRCDNVRVALGLAHMADNLRPYAQRVRCPVAILRGSSGAELTRQQAESMASFWPNAEIVDLEGDYALQMENPAGLAQALTALATSGARA